MKFVINGGKKLSGNVSISGSKNSALALIAATILSNDECILDNVPDIYDVDVMLEILSRLGAVIKRADHKVIISCKNLKNEKPDEKLTKKLRASVLLLGPLLSRFGFIEMRHPGGDIIGKRPVDTHLEAFVNLGAQIEREADCYHLKASKLIGTKMFLDEVSVTATENTIMASVLAEGRTEISPAACEPHVVDLVRFLRKMGANISGEGSHTIIIEGVDKLHGAQHQVISDYLEAGTFAILGAATNSELSIQNISFEQVVPVMHKLKQMGANVEYKNDILYIKTSNQLNAAKIQIDTWPRLPTDLQAPFCVLATQARGTSLIHDWMFERRLNYIDELIKMGADIILCDPHRALVTGPSLLTGTMIISPDIRAGIALVIAALVANGTSHIDNVHLIDRGYEHIDQKLQDIGADIIRINE